MAPKGYLMAYNLCSAIGWAFVLYKLIETYQKSQTNPKLQIWDEMGTILTYVQTTAVLEIIHSLLGFVRSPIMTVLMQVGSRVWIVWMYMMPSKAGHNHWSFYLCVGAWCLVEIPRYLFYLVSLNYDKSQSHKIPYFLFYLRYSLFIILYPSGITGEILQILNSFTESEPLLSHGSFLNRFVTFHLIIYIPFGPYLINNMWRNRKRSFKKRAQLENPRPLNGLIWPVTNEKTKERSGTKTNKAVWAGSVENVDKGVCDKVNKERNWRFGYAKHVMNNVVLSCQSKKNALAVAESGLNKAYELFEFMRDGKTIPFKDAMAKGGVFSKNIYETHIIEGNLRGKGGKNSNNVEIPYGGGKYQGQAYYLGKNDKTVISGMELKNQLKKWVEYGTIEESAAEAIAMVSNNKDKWLDLSNDYFILLGATSAMGPLYFLLKHGANVVAVDLDRDFIWNKLFDAVRNSPGRLIFPVKKSELGNKNLNDLKDSELAKISGSNLLSDTPEIANWLCTSVLSMKEVNHPSSRLMIGNYTYLDGALHVQLSLACDSIIERVCDERKDTSIAFLCTPTDNHIVPKEAYLASKEALKTRVPTWASLINTVLGGKFLGQANYKAMKSVNNDLYVIDGIAVAQGPNYALAKRLQHWRAIIQHSKGHIVSSNVAPSTATESVVHNAQFAAAYGGMHYFAPMEVMYQRTSLAVMCILLIHDLNNKEGVANPQSKLSKSLKNPLELIKYGSFHGGVWRCSYKIDSIGVPSAVAYYLKTYKFAIIGTVGGLVSTVSWLASGKVSPF